MDTVTHLKTEREDLFAQFKQDCNVQKLARQLCEITDARLIQAWDKHNIGISASLLAVGGFGRKELFPYSDIDILVLLDDTLPEEEKASLLKKIEGFITECWDLGLEIGSSVRSVHECLHEADLDITVRTAMLESRLIHGNKKLYREFQNQFNASIDAKSFFQAKLLELRQRHHKFNDTPYALEPNCKESPGGLRDLQVILWMTKAAKLGDSFAALHKKGLLTKRESLEINRNLRFLQTLRTHLHLVAKRRQDVLVFDLQT